MNQINYLSISNTTPSLRKNILNISGSFSTNISDIVNAMATVDKSAEANRFAVKLDILKLCTNYFKRTINTLSKSFRDAEVEKCNILVIADKILYLTVKFTVEEKT